MPLTIHSRPKKKCHHRQSLFSGFLNVEKQDINHLAELPRILMNICSPHGHHQEVPSLHRALDEVRREKTIRD